MANPYLTVLRTPHAVPMVLAAGSGRLPLARVGLGGVLLVQDYTGSYGVGGAVTAASAGPIVGRLADTDSGTRSLTFAPPFVYQVDELDAERVGWCHS